MTKLGARPSVNMGYHSLPAEELDRWEEKQQLWDKAHAIELEIEEHNRRFNGHRLSWHHVFGAADHKRWEEDEEYFLNQERILEQRFEWAVNNYLGISNA